MDPNQQAYNDDAVMRLYKLCKQTLGAQIKQYYLGLPSQPPTDLDYPCMVIQKMSGNYQINATQTDQRVEKIAVMLFTKKSDNSAGANDPGITTLRELQNLVEGESSSGLASQGYPTFQPGTLLSVLRTDFTLSYYTINASLEVSYDMTARSSEDGKPLPGLAQANILLTLTEKVIVPGRT